MRRTFATVALALGLALATACTPSQGETWHNNNHAGGARVTANSAEAEQASRLFTAYWRAVVRGAAAEQRALVSRWSGVANCESGGNWSINTGNGYYGGLQFSLSSWRAVGGSGYPHQASAYEQAVRGEKLKAIQGLGAWPHCGAYYR
jgi:hypothetical protein